jgi:hypothetical protein
MRWIPGALVTVPTPSETTDPADPEGCSVRGSQVHSVCGAAAGFHRCRLSEDSPRSLLALIVAVLFEVPQSIRGFEKLSSACQLVRGHV